MCTPRLFPRHITCCIQCIFIKIIYWWSKMIPTCMLHNEYNICTYMWSRHICSLRTRVCTFRWYLYLDNLDDPMVSLQDPLIFILSELEHRNCFMIHWSFYVIFSNMFFCMYVCVYVSVCVCACACACVRVRVRACVRVCSLIFKTYCIIKYLLYIGQYLFDNLNHKIESQFSYTKLKRLIIGQNGCAHVRTGRRKKGIVWV
jgi:hypothetical protein